MMLADGFPSDTFAVEALPLTNDIPEVMYHWKECWTTAGYTDDSFQSDWKERMHRFFQSASYSGLKPQSFVARCHKTGAILGSIHCQIWAGPIPWVVQPDTFRLGTVWGLYVSCCDSATSSQIHKRLTSAALAHLQQQQCTKVVTLALDSPSRDTLLKTAEGFQQANMLTLDLSDQVIQDLGSPEFIEKGSIHYSPVGKNHDDTVCSHWRKMWRDVGIPDSALIPNMTDVTLSFLENAREKLHYQTFAAQCIASNKFVGSISCQVWEGPFPKIIRQDRFQLGTIWAVYVDPEYRRQGVATTLMKHALTHLQQVGCKSAILIAASEAGQRVYEHLGFRPNNALVCDLNTNCTRETKEKVFTKEEKKQDHPSKDIHDSISTIPKMADEIEAQLSGLQPHATKQQIIAMCTATDRQLAAVYCMVKNGGDIIDAITNVQKKYGLYVDPMDNWFTRNIKKLGRGFDMKKLADDPAVLAAKFDRLSTKYDDWTVGNKSQVESFIVRCAENNPSLLRDRDPLLSKKGCQRPRILDVACGIGLQGQVLRLCGIDGEFVGNDISPGMVERTQYRGCYDHVYVANANNGIALDGLVDSQHLFDVVICTGALELLDQPKVLADMADLTKPDGEIWVSFQLSEELESAVLEQTNPTFHQNVNGITRQKAVALLTNAGFTRITLEEKCTDAFFTPSPAQDGTVLPVPYLFVVAKK